MKTEIKNGKIERKIIKKEKIPFEAFMKHQNILTRLQIDGSPFLDKYYQVAEQLDAISERYGFENKFKIYFDDEIKGGGLTVNTKNGAKYIAINPNRLELKEDILLYLVTHEAIGHAYFNNIDVKTGSKMEVVQSGFNIDIKKVKNDNLETGIKTSIEKLKRFRDIVAVLPDANIPIMTSILKKLSKGDVLNDSERVGVEFFKKNLILDNDQDLVQIMNDHINDVKNSTNNESKNIGLDLEEGGTDYLAAKLVYGSRGKWVESGAKDFSEYHKLDERLFDLDNYLEKNHPVDMVKFGEAEVTGFDSALMDSKKKNSPGMIGLYLRKRTGVKLTPKELFELDFSRIYSKKQLKTNG